MATRRSTGGRRGRSGGPPWGALLLGILLGIAIAAAGAAIYLRFGKPPVAVGDAAALWEPLVHSVPLRSRARTEAKTPPFPASEDVFEAGARTYRAHCGECHGAPGSNSAQGLAMSPQATQFFALKERKQMSAKAPGEMYWATAYGIRGSGMPAFGKQMTDTQLWQVSLLLHGAGDDLPQPVADLLTGATR